MGEECAEEDSWYCCLPAEEEEWCAWRLLLVALAVEERGPGFALAKGLLALGGLVMGGETVVGEGTELGSGISTVPPEEMSLMENSINKEGI